MNSRENKSKEFGVILLGAALDTGNMGVSALASSLIQLILKQVPNAKVSLFIGNRSSKPQHVIVNGNEELLNVLNFRLSPKARLDQHLFWIFFLAFFQRLIPIISLKEKIIHSNRCLSEIYNASLIGDVHGGDSFSDIYGPRRFFIGSIPNLIVLLLKKDLTMFPQTYGPYSTIVGRLTAKVILKRSKNIFSRDKTSIEVVKELLKDNEREIHFCPDVAFTLDKIEPKIINIEPVLEKNDNIEVVGLNVNALMYHGGYTRNNMFGLQLDYKSFINNLVPHLLKDVNRHILLIPHNFGPRGDVNSDPDACQEILDEFQDTHRGRIHLVSTEYNQYEIKAVIGTTDFFIGSRMHACIAAISQGIPTIAVAYSRKFKGVFESIGFGDMVIDARDTEQEEAVSKIVNSVETYPESKPEILGQINQARNQIYQNFETIVH
jgi:polysaccharide pyruvyl transferase WcaK-like protein